MAEQQIEYSRYMTAPTIFNNALWHCIAEGDSMYYQGLYSVFDEEPRIMQWNYFPKNHMLIKPYEDERSIKTLKWFSNNYYNIIRRNDGRLQLNDMRYGTRSHEKMSEEDYIFAFILEEKNGKLEAEGVRGEFEFSESIKQLWTRIKGLSSEKR